MMKYLVSLKRWGLAWQLYNSLLSLWTADAFHNILCRIVCAHLYTVYASKAWLNTAYNSQSILWNHILSQHETASAFLTCIRIVGVLAIVTSNKCCCWYALRYPAECLLEYVWRRRLRRFSYSNFIVYMENRCVYICMENWCARA